MQRGFAGLQEFYEGLYKNKDKWEPEMYYISIYRLLVNIIHIILIKSNIIYLYYIFILYITIYYIYYIIIYYLYII